MREAKGLAHLCITSKVCIKNSPFAFLNKSQPHPLILWGAAVAADGVRLRAGQRSGCERAKPDDAVDAVLLLERPGLSDGMRANADEASADLAVVVLADQFASAADAEGR